MPPFTRRPSYQFLSPTLPELVSLFLSLPFFIVLFLSNPFHLKTDFAPNLPGPPLFSIRARVAKSEWIVMLGTTDVLLVPQSRSV